MEYSIKAQAHILWGQYLGFVENLSKKQYETEDK
jgi:hypothetical protein